jgi:hypothetical protein
MEKYRTDSLYRNTEVVGSKFLDVLSIDNIDVKNTITKTITLEPKHNERPDLLAYELYGNSKLWWAFALFNQDKLQDPIIDFKSGLHIIVPVRFA